MLRRIFACFNVISLLLVSLVPLTPTAAARTQTPDTATTPTTNSKLAPELQSTGSGANTGSSAPGQISDFLPVILRLR